MLCQEVSDVGGEKDGGGGEDGTGHCNVTGGYLSV